MPPFIIHSVHYNTVSTTYVVEPKILLNSVHVLHSNIQWIFSNHMSTYLWNDIYENLVVKSVVLNRFSLLGSFSWSSVDASSFVCVVILSLYLTLNFVTASLIVCTFKSAYKSSLDIYHGPFTVARRSLFWYLYNISMFDLLAVPRRGIRNVQMCFRIFL
jgi:hypothetical protein